MPVDVERAMAAEFADETISWEEDDVILYHLGIGAGNPPTSPAELAYTYETQLKVLPSFAVIPVGKLLINTMLSIPGLDFNPVMLLHGEQEIEIPRPIPTAAKAVNSTRIAGIYDKAKAALVILETTTRSLEGDVLFVNRFSMFLRGEGGFGGSPGPRAEHRPPDRAADQVIESTTLPQQALIYRLSGDKNPLHCDPDFAAMGGFDKPILHGLCTYGVVCKGVVDQMLDGDVGRVKGYAVRFRGVVFPGETLITSAWREGSNILIETKTKERDSAVLSNAVIRTGD